MKEEMPEGKMQTQTNRRNHRKEKHEEMANYRKETDQEAEVHSLRIDHCYNKH